MPTQVGPIGLPMANLKGTLSRCYAIQNWQGNSWTEAETAARIHENGLPAPANGNEHTLDELNSYRPFIELFIGEDGILLELDAGGAGNHYHDSGVILARFEQNVHPDYQGKAEAEQEFDLFIDNVLRANYPDGDSFIDLSSSPGEFIAKSIHVEPSERVHPKDRRQFGDAQARYVAFEFGSV